MRKSRGIRGNHLTFQLITRTPRSGCSKPSGVRPVKPRALGVLSHLKLGLSHSVRLVLPLSAAPAASRAQGTARTGARVPRAHRWQHGRSLRVRRPARHPAGPARPPGAELTDVHPEPGQGLAAVLPALGPPAPVRAAGRPRTRRSLHRSPGPAVPAPRRGRPRSAPSAAPRAPPTSPGRSPVSRVAQRPHRRTDPQRHRNPRRHQERASYPACRRPRQRTHAPSDSRSSSPERSAHDWLTPGYSCRRRSRSVQPTAVAGEAVEGFAAGQPKARTCSGAGQKGQARHPMITLCAAAPPKTAKYPPLSQARFSMSSLYTQQAFGVGEDTLSTAVSPPHRK